LAQCSAAKPFAAQISSTCGHLAPFGRGEHDLAGCVRERFGGEPFVAPIRIASAQLGQERGKRLRGGRQHAERVGAEDIGPGIVPRHADHRAAHALHRADHPRADRRVAEADQQLGAVETEPLAFGKRVGGGQRAGQAEVPHAAGGVGKQRVARGFDQLGKRGRGKGLVCAGQDQSSCARPDSTTPYHLRRFLDICHRLGFDASARGGGSTTSPGGSSSVAQ
jgi:hypothetical protein